MPPRRLGGYWGYSERWRFGEDAGFLVDLKRLGRTRKQRFLRLAGVPAVYSTRKFEQFGDWHYVATAVKLPFWLVRRGRLARWAEDHGYGQQRARPPI